MTLNKILQRENDRLKEDLEDLRDSDICTFIWSWDVFQENLRLWDGMTGLACDLRPRQCSSGYVHTTDGKHLLCEGLSYHD